jgi:predicted SAM-dependent methyltransferase
MRSIIEALPKDFRSSNRDVWYSLQSDIRSLAGRVKRQFVRLDFPRTTQINLHLGCGQIDHPGFINIDGFPGKHIHYVRDISNLSVFKDETVDLIYACHCLEHFPYNGVSKVLAEWYRVLKKNGILRISVPDFELMLKIYLDNGKDINAILGPLMGGQSNKFDFHKTAFTKASLTELFVKAGFQEVREWKFGSDHLTSIEDWSKKSIIWQGKEYLISLNLEAIK